jgi:D-arabinose 1-dehydrogenase-like Zn-dependent alcohol dehydrogenase
VRLARPDFAALAPILCARVTTYKGINSGTPHGASKGHGEPRRAAARRFPDPIFDVVLKRITIRSSIVGRRQDLAEALAFAAHGKVNTHIHHARLEDVNDVLAALHSGRVDGRIVLDIAAA